MMVAVSGSTNTQLYLDLFWPYLTGIPLEGTVTSAFEVPNLKKKKRPGKIIQALNPCNRWQKKSLCLATLAAVGVTA